MVLVLVNRVVYLQQVALVVSMVLLAVHMHSRAASLGDHMLQWTTPMVDMATHLLHHSTWRVHTV